MKKFELFAASALALVISMPAVGQTNTPSLPSDPPRTSASSAPDNGKDEEIIVTATKREQTLQDVPISVSVTSQATIERAQIRDLIDLQSVVPSLKVAQLNAVGQTNFIIRGFGNGNGNDGIESSVGVFIDGVYRSRSAAGLDDLPEIERVEVLRGPQSTLFGKNVSAGAISIVTKKPSFEGGGKAEITYGNFNQMQARATVTGPISETIAVRLSGSVNQRDGYFRNVTTGSDVNDRNRHSIRGDILWQPSSDFSLRVIADYNLIKERCCGVLTILNGPATQLIGAPVSAGGVGKNIGNPAAVFDRNVIFNTNPTNRVRGEGISAQADWDVGFAKLTSITAYRNQVNQSQQDIDFTAADISNNTTANEIKTFTQEIRLASDGNGPFSWLLGGFYQDEKLDTGRRVAFGTDARTYLNALTGGLLPLLEGLQGLPTGTYFAPGQGITDNYKLKQRSFSIFGQADYKVTDRLTLTGGLSYLNDRKAAQSDVVVTDQFSLLNLENIPRFGFVPFAALPASVAGCLLQKGYVPGGTVPVNLFGSSLGSRLPGPGSAPCPASRAGVNPFALNGAQFFYANTANHAPVNFPNANESGILKGDKVTYAARAAYDFGFVNAYASYSTGWKAGAYNLSSDSRPPDANGVGRSAAPENVTVYEAGLKAKFTGGYFNLAVFKQTIKGFQSNAFTGLGYSLVNAGKESVKGFEIDAAYRPISFLSFTAAATYLDPKFDSFTGAACVNYDTVRCPINPLTGLRPNFRDLTGTVPAGIPKWSVSTSATLSHDLSDGINAYLRGEYDYTSKFQLTDTTPPELSTYGQNIVNASIGVTFVKAQLEVMGFVRNLTQDNFLISTFPTVAQDGSYSGYPNQPRTYGITVRKSF
ncbi:TonB-dependent receptor [Sphingomonas sp. Leaf357]|uniref:TonB-dependent receptor n=1 Tax=Sphingomonas sp. Leaf357 TaxID=1736350 RepID=UPI0006FB0D59|nr:TonB-dependent receptor [Sphingomonas sp. Leaf357]KQS01488.1 TonB-dependent receptor [Sphingomonas sp. Leaf357]